MGHHHVQYGEQCVRGVATRIGLAQHDTACRSGSGTRHVQYREQCARGVATRIGLAKLDAA